VRGIGLRVTGGPAGDVVHASLAGSVETLTVGPGETREARLEPGRGFPYYDTFLYVLRFGSEGSATAARGEGPDGCTGAFVHLALDVGK